MKFVSIKTYAAAEDLWYALEDPEGTNKNVKFDEVNGKPLMHVKRKDKSLKIKCEYLSKNKKDNEFLFGTTFKGKVTEKDGVTTVSGIITTEPIYHVITYLLFAVFAVQFFYFLIAEGAFSFPFVPIMVVFLDFFMFRAEFKKQGIIKRYIARAVRRAEFIFERRREEAENGGVAEEVNTPSDNVE